MSELAEAAAQADALAEAGSERELAELRAKWSDDLEAAARGGDFRERAVAYRAIGQFRWRAKEELLRRGLDDESPAARGSALLSLELLSRDHPSTSTTSGRCCTRWRPRTGMRRCAASRSSA